MGGFCDGVCCLMGVSVIVDFNVLVCGGDNVFVVVCFWMILIDLFYELVLLL